MKTPGKSVVPPLFGTGDPRMNHRGVLRPGTMSPRRVVGEAGPDRLTGGSTALRRIEPKTVQEARK
jgi:hypothetical protein